MVSARKTSAGDMAQPRVLCDPTGFGDEELAQRRRALAQIAERMSRSDSEPAMPRPTVRPDRAGMRMVAAYLEADAHAAFKALAARRRTTGKAALTKAIALYFEDCAEPVPQSVVRELKRNYLG
jgi:hypothetical protein